MANETIEGLREHLFATLAALRDPEKPMEVERARAVADVAGKIIESEKVEVSYMKEVGGKGSGFIPEAPRRAALEAPTNGAGRRQ
jgi:hypothetical protein